MLDQVGLIHMNGRIYDARLARFLQADPFIDGAGYTQGYNRYSYVHNNPLNSTDPTGHIRKFVGAIVGIVGAVICGPACAQIGWQVVAVGAAAGAAGAAANGGNILKGAVLGGISAAGFSAVGGSELFGYSYGDGFGQLALNALGNGVVGGITNVLQGGKFGHGFASAGLSAFFKPSTRGAFGVSARNAPFRVIARAVIGGTISKVTGGKFSNGAVTSAFSQIFNEESTLARYRKNIREQLNRSIDRALNFSNEALDKSKHVLGFFSSDEFFDSFYRAGSLIGGGAQVYAGGLLCVGSGGLACAGGVGLMALGADNITEGLSNNSVQPLRSALGSVIDDQQTVDLVHAGINVTSSAAAAFRQIPRTDLIGVGERSTQAAISRASRLEIGIEVSSTTTAITGPLRE
ncbi:MAG: hypothetical protein GYB33_09870, partial [Gammaproteobacteria bacterium]|nr:hypothetical protein [Gammaproteobacteria bacterium]